MKANLYDRPIARPACNRRRGLRFLASAAAPVLAVIAGPGSNAFGQTSYTWLGSNGNWSTSTDWNPNGVPGTENGDTAVIETSGAAPVTITYNYSGSANTLGDVTVDYTGSAAGGGNTLSISANLSLNAETENVGDIGSATVDQGAGSNMVTSGPLVLGDDIGATGTYNLGGGSVTDVTDVEQIGYDGNGTFDQTGGTNTEDSYNIYLGNQPGSHGLYSLSNGTVIDNGGNYPLTVGLYGNGTFIQSGGTNACACDITLGWYAGSVGTYDLANGNVTVDQSVGAIFVGNDGNGTFNQTGGTLTLAPNNNLDLGAYSGGNGTFSISAGTANIGNFIEVGGTEDNGAGGSGVVTVSGSGTLAVGSSVIVYNNPGNALNLEGGELSTPTLDLNGNTTLLNWTGGTLNLTDSSVAVDNQVGTLGPNGDLPLASGQTLDVTGYEYIGFQGSGTVTQTGGNNYVIPGEYGAHDLVVGDGSGASGLYNLSSGTLEVVQGNEYVGASGNGTFNQTGGINFLLSGGELSIAQNAGSTGAYNLSGGTLTANNVYVGGYDSGAGGSGTLAVSGSGTLNASQSITVYATSGTAFNVNGGSVAAGALNLSGNYSQSAGSATFGQITGSGKIALSGGMLALNTDVNSTAATLTSSGSATLGFDIGSSASSELVLTTAIFNSTPTLDFTLSGFPSSGTQYTILSASNLSDNGFLNNLSAQQETIDGETLTPSFTGGGGGAGEIIVTVTGAPALNLTWTGSDGQNWDNGATPNWRGASSTFAAGANVTFDDSASGFTVDIDSGDVSPASVTFDNNYNAYIVNGTNAIAGSTGVSFEGADTVTLNNNNTYSGATTISGGGTVILNGTNASPTFNISDGTLVMGGSNLLTADPVVNLGNGTTAGTLDLDGSSTTIGGLAGQSGFATVTNNQPFTTATLTVSGGNSTYNGTIQDGNGGENPVALNLTSGSLTLTNNNPYSGGTTIGGGTLTVSNSSGSATGSGNVTLNGGVLASGSVGIIAGNVLAGSAPHTIAPGGIGAVGTLSVGGLTTSNQTTLSFQLGTGSGTITNGSELILGSGNVSVGSGTQMSFTGTPVAGDDYRLIGDTSGGSVVDGITLSDFTLPSAPSGLSYSLSNSVDADFIDLVVGSTGPVSVFWDNAGAPPPVANGTTWDSTNVNWNSGSSGATYADGDAVTFNDTNNGHYQVTLSTTVKPASILVNNTSGNYSITGSGTIIDTGSFTKSGSGTLTLGTGLTASSLTIGSGKLALATNTTLGSGSTLGPVSSNINISSLTITLAGTLDIANNHILIDYTSSDPIAAIHQYLLNGYNNGHWNGPGGIISSAAALNSHYGIGWADGGDGTHSVSGLLGGEIELKYTLLGDANLDGTVNGSDFSILAANFGLGHTNWDQGNFLYGSSVNGSDFSALAANFGQGDSGAAVAVSPADIAALDAFAIANGLPLPTIAAVPEPATLGLLTLSSMGLLLKRRRRHVWN